MKLIITIDTEEDNWNRYSATDNPVENIESVAELQYLFDSYSVKPTYLITYPVASNPKSIKILREISDSGRCEIGMHCHPWNTPPINSINKINKHETMLCNLSENIVETKLSFLHSTIEHNFNVTPVSFRAGRYGFGQHVAKTLCRLGYHTDTSVTPYSTWKSNYGVDYSDFGPEIFRFGEHGLSDKSTDGPLIQVPVTVGYLQSNHDRCRNIELFIENRFPFFFHAKGILARIGALNKVWLTPEFSSPNEMIRLAKRFKKLGHPCINMVFHSSSLMPGNTPFVKDSSDRKQLLKTIEKFIRFTCDSGIESLTLSEFRNFVLFNRTV